MTQRASDTTLHDMTGPRLVSVAAFALIVLGAAPRFTQFLHYRPLWLDEAALAANLLHKGPLDLFGPLENHQIAPPAYLLLSKACIAVFGVNEYAARLPSIIAGVAALPLFWLLARRILEPIGALAALALFATATHVIYYASEAKPYSLDIALAVLLWLLAVPPETKPFGPSRWAVLGAAGAIAVWFSYPSAFVLACIGIVLAIDAVMRRDGRTAISAMAVSSVWLASFLVLYAVHIRPIRAQADTMAYMDNYWSYAGAYMPWPTFSTYYFDWVKTRFLMFFDMPGGFELAGLAAFAFLTGCWFLAGRKWAFSALLLFPILITLLVSAFKLYPFHGRMTFFLAPAMLLFIGEGIGGLHRTLPREGRPVAWLLFAMLVALPTYHSAGIVMRPKSHHELHKALAYVQDHWREGDVLILRYHDGLAYAFCKNRFRIPEDRTWIDEKPMSDASVWAGDVANRLQTLGLLRRVWFATTYEFGEELTPLLDALDEHVRLIDRFDAAGAAALAYGFEDRGSSIRPRRTRP